MNYYNDIIVLPDPEASASVLMSNLMAKFHRTLVSLNQPEIGVSFPRYKKTLGEVFRLHGNLPELEELMQSNWLKGLRDYCEVSSILAVPKDCQFRSVFRVQAKSAANKRKRSVAKGWLSEEEASSQILDKQQIVLKLPFVQLKSQSTGQQIKLFIQQGDLLNESREGRFNSYGLSKTATIPWF